MIYCWHDLLFIFCLLLFYLFHPSMGWLCGVGVFGLIECYSVSPGLAQRTPNDNDNNNKNNNNNNKVCFVKLQVISISSKYCCVLVVYVYL